MSHDTPVLVAGGGPVGITFAMDLARMGVSSIVLERRHDMAPNPRCNTTNARSMELLRRLGCADAVRSAGLPPDHSTDIVYLTQLNGFELTRFSRSTVAEVRAGNQHGVAANWPTPEPQHYLSQLYLEPVLRAAAVDKWNVDVRFGWELVSFTQDASAVTTTIRHVESGELQTITSEYLLGADGSNSFVRGEIGARLEGIPRLSDTVSTFVRSKRIKELVADVPAWMFRFMGGTVMVAIDGDEKFLIHNGLVPGEPIDRETYEPEPAMFQAIGEPFDYEILGRARWTPRAMVANKFREGRVFLAGDAAHLWIPLGGFGMNAGMVDAISLSWRLAGVLQGWLDDKILDTYETERAPVGSRVATQAAKWGADLRPLQHYTPERLAELNSSEAARRELGAQIAEVNISEFESPGFQLGSLYPDSPVICHDDFTPRPIESVVVYQESSWPGVRLPHSWHADGASLFDQLGTGFTLLRMGPNPPAGSALVAAAAERRVPFTVVDVPEAEAKYEGFELLLVRPDQHVVWRSHTDPPVEVAAEVLNRVTGRLLEARTVRVRTAERFNVETTSQPIARVRSTDGAIEYYAEDDRVTQARVHPDGSLSQPRTFVRHAAKSLCADADGGLWLVVDNGAFRFDSAGRATDAVTVDGITSAAATVDDVLVLTGVAAGRPTSWSVKR